MSSGSPFKSNLSVRQSRSSPFRRPEPGSPASRPSSVIGPQSPSRSPVKHSDSTRQNRPFSPNLAHSPSRSSETEAYQRARPEVNRSPSRSSVEPPPPLFVARDSLRPSSNHRHSQSSSPMPSRAPGLDEARGSSNASTARSPNPQPSQLRAAPPLKLKSAMADPLACIPPAQLHTMRESFAVLDRSNSGVITAADVADMLGQLGMESTPAVLAHFFPPGVKEINLAGYLSSLASPMANAASQSELREALAAFDDDDSGQIDLLKLKRALCSTIPENGDPPLSEAEIDGILQPFSGRRSFTRHRNANVDHRGLVFKYEDFLNAMYATAPNAGTPTQSSSEGGMPGR